MNVFIHEILEEMSMKNNFQRGKNAVRKYFVALLMLYWFTNTLNIKLLWRRFKEILDIQLHFTSSPKYIEKYLHTHTHERKLVSPFHINPCHGEFVQINNIVIIKIDE
jgi:hypothetical protein